MFKRTFRRILLKVYFEKHVNVKKISTTKNTYFETFNINLRKK